jgi:transcriptional regulator of arginine metabolism
MLHNYVHILYKYEFALTEMNGMKLQRQSTIRDLVERESITSQEQLRMRLRDRGIDATQATLSRDIRELGLVKRASDGAYRSVGSVSNGDSADAQVGLARATAEHLRSHEVVGHMIVLKTDSGQAQTLAVAIDRARLAGIVGTIAGDDTILVICRRPEAALAVAERFVETRIEA